MKLTARPSPSIAPSQTVSPRLTGCGHGSARAPIDRRRQPVERRGREVAARIDGHVRRVGDMRVAHHERLLGRLDEPMHVVEAVGVADAEAIEQAEDHHRREALRRRRHAIGRAVLQPHRQRRRPRARDGVARSASRSGLPAASRSARHAAREIAAIEVVEAGAREMIERSGELAAAGTARRSRAGCRPA